jgi:hypothetical protein
LGRERLDLFRTVCAAVQYRTSVWDPSGPEAEQIFVGSDGVPKLLDFGIAKLLGADGWEARRRFDGGG